MGAEGSTKRVSDDGRPTGATTNGAVATPARPLTRRENEVAALVAEGLTNRQIAKKLFVSERTAEYHVEQIRNKLGFHTRSQIASWATQANGHPVPIALVRAVTVRLPIYRRVLIDPRLRALALTLMAALVATGGGLAYVLSRPAASTPAPVDGVVQLDARTTRSIQMIPTSPRGSQIAIGEGYVWQVSYTGRTLKRIDPRTQQVTSYGVGAPPVGIAIGDHAIWVATAYGSKSLFRFDPRTFQFAPPIEVASGLQAIAFGSNSVWATDKNDDAVYRIDPLTARVMARIPVGDGPEAIAVSGSTVWVGNGVDRTVSRIDAGLSTVVATIPMRGTPTAMATGHGAVWVASDPGRLVTRIDAATNATLEIQIDGAPTDVAISDGAVWVSEGVAGGVIRIDPSTHRTSAVALNGLADGIAADGSSVWVSAHNQPAPQVGGPATRAIRGGTLRVVVPAWRLSDLANPQPQPSALDPDLSTGLDAAEILRCCLLRTLFSRPGRSYQDGGAKLYPDLAAGMPQVSADGRTWTFQIRQGLRYAPPMQRVEITAGDFVRALQRDARLDASTPAPFSVIDGFDDYAAQKASAITGLSTPNRYTLKVHLNQVTTDLADRFALTQSAPIPASPLDPSARFGVATGHDDGEGQFLVASGPYMIEGSPQLDFSLPPDRQRPVSGFQLSHSLSLVRNPSWSAAVDPLRPAYLERIQFTIGVSDEVAAQMLDAAQADLIMRASPPPQIVPAYLQKVVANAHLGQVAVNSRDSLRAVVMNLAVPPFDDVHVRRAVNYILDKRALIAAHGGDLTGQIASHYVPDGLEGGALTSYDPYATADATGGLELAMQEMKQSAYDPEHTGMCSVPTCKHLLAVAFKGATGPFPQLGGFPMLARMIAADLARIGILVEVQIPVPFRDDPSQRIPLDLTQGLGPAFLNASSTFSGDFSAFGNEALLGTTPDQLKFWKYHVLDVVTIEPRIKECMSTFTTPRQSACWTALDIYLMEQVVPIAPYLWENVAEVVPKRLARYSFDQSWASPALDQIAVQGQHASP